MIIPQATQKQALCIIDVQPKTFKAKQAENIVENICKVIENVDYDAYIIVDFFSPKESSLYKQTFDYVSKEDAGSTDQRILDLLYDKKNVCFVEKTDRSCFAGENQQTILEFLSALAINEIHFAGFDIDDCVLASLYGSLGCGLYSYVLEELVGHHAHNEGLYTAAVSILRHHHLTNNSIHPRISSIVIDLSWETNITNT